MHKDRALVAALVVLAAVSSAAYLRQAGPSRMPGCLFRRLTDLECPGCGMTRATYALLHGKFNEAFQLNPVGIILLPLVLMMIGINLIAWVRGRPMPIFANPGIGTAVCILLLVIGWLVLRNVF